FRDQQGMRLQERCFGIALKKGKSKYPEEIGIHEGKILLRKRFFAGNKTRPSICAQPCCFQNFRIISPECLGSRWHHVGLFHFFSLYGAAEYHTDNPVGLFIEAVVAEFMDHKKQDKQTGGNANGQSKNIDGREGFIAPEIAETELKIISEHGLLLEIHPDNHDT